MLKSSLAAATAVSLFACVSQDATPSSIDKALPTADQISIKLPETAARTLDAAGDPQAVGDLASWYVATRAVTRMFNGGSAWVLIVIHTVVQLPPTTASGDTFTWGPWSNALDPAEYKLVVKVVGDGTYTYQLSGRSKTQANSQFEVVIDGTADARAGEGKGNGEFLIDFDASKRVNPIDAGDAKGTIDVHYDLAARHLGLTVMTTDAVGAPVAADYAYNEAADGGGDMVFDADTNAGGTSALEQLTLRSRWLATGAGRADARITGGDLGQVQITASECWSAAFARVYYQDSNRFAPAEGDVSACAFATADLPAAH